MCPHGMLLTHFYAQKPVLCKINLHFRALYPEPLPSCLLLWDMLCMQLGSPLSSFHLCLPGEGLLV